MSAPETPAVNGPAFEQLLEQVRACSRDEKRALLDRILRDLIGDDPRQEYVLPNPDGSSYVFLVPPHLFRASWETPEFNAELRRRASSGSKGIPNSEVIARLQALQAREQPS